MEFDETFYLNNMYTNKNLKMKEIESMSTQQQISKKVK